MVNICIPIMQMMSVCLSAMKFTVMIWRSWVWTPVGLNLGRVELLFKSYLNQKYFDVSL